MSKITLMILQKSEIFTLTINFHYNLKHIPQFSVNLIYMVFSIVRGQYHIWPATLLRRDSSTGVFL